MACFCKINTVILRDGSASAFLEYKYRNLPDEKGMIT